MQIRPYSAPVTFGNKEKLQAYVQTQSDNRARRQKQLLSEPVLPPITGAEAITGLDLLKAVQDYLESQEKPLEKAFSLNDFLEKFLGISNRENTEMTQLYEQLAKVVQNDWNAQGLVKRANSSGYSHSYILTSDAIAALKVGEKTQKPDAPNWL